MENKNGSYDLEGIIWHQHSNKLMVKIMELWSDKTVPIFDLGCGHNFYVNVLLHARYMSAGFDMVFFPGVRIQDITKPIDYIDLEKKINILSLEVGEHIPEDLAAGYLDNLTRFGGDVIMSWALPGQAGVGHINCQTNTWVIDEMSKRGYIIDSEKTIQLRTAVNGCHCTWFQNTLMYFTPKP